jgi:hypothetical protein
MALLHSRAAIHVIKQIKQLREQQRFAKIFKYEIFVMLSLILSLLVNN